MQQRRLFIFGVKGRSVDRDFLSFLFHCCSVDVLLLGSGKTVVAELAMLRLFSMSPKKKTVYIAPLKALAAERMQDW